MNKIINWMGGWPKEGLVSSSDWEERLASAAERFRRLGGTMDAHDALKELLAQRLLKAKTRGRSDRLRLAAGADAALARLTQRALAPGDVVLTARLTSRTALLTFRKAGIRVESVESDGEGIDPDALRDAIDLVRPRLLYAAPVCSDPEGAVWTPDRIAAVTRVCRETGVTFVRDDRQEPMLYDDTVISRLEEPAEDGHLSIGQLPPGLVAGLRIGWIAGEPAELDRWYLPDAYSDASKEPGVTPIEKQALADLLLDQPLEPLLDMMRVQSAVRMRRLTELLKPRRSSGLSWRPPQGGVHLWLSLPEGLDGEALLRGAWVKGLMFQPGAPFYADKPERNTLRLTFAHTDERQLKLGAARLTEAMDDFLGRSLM